LNYKKPRQRWNLVCLAARKASFRSDIFAKYKKRPQNDNQHSMYTTEGIILKRVATGEADSLFTIYTKDFGKIMALAQGVKKEGAKLKGHLETLSLTNIGFVMGKNGERLTHAILLNYWSAMRADREKLQLAYAISELVDQNTMLGEQDEKLWELLVGAFRFLEYGMVGDNFLEEFKEKLTAVLGYT